MIKTCELFLSPAEAANHDALYGHAAEYLNISRNKITHILIKKKSIDARSKKIKLRILVDVYQDEPPPDEQDFGKEFLWNKNVSNSQQVVIAGFGPAGMFAALRLIELGLKPVVVERGKKIKDRRRDLAALNKSGLLNPDSNYCFGEGGAGTFSDGKLYTRSNKRGDINRILKALVVHGASQDIMVESHPHIGTNKLPKLIESIRECILRCGGEIHFESRLDDLIIHQHKIEGAIVNQNGLMKQIKTKAVLLATGHSARDIFNLLKSKRLAIEAKPFALGVRMEHPQELIDKIQYHCSIRDPYLPPASYSLTAQVNGRGVYSFCMCPGGIIAPAATNDGEIVVNGWSPSKRNNKFANSGLVVSVDHRDFEPFVKEFQELAGMQFQAQVERKAFDAGGGQMKAPAQRLIDFAENIFSDSLPECSYIPGVTSADLSNVLPVTISESIRKALPVFKNKMKGFYTNAALLVAVESRTSSPVRIPRNKEDLMHPQVHGLFPCGEGAGYAGGIVSAAIDGEKCAEAIRNIL